MSIKPIDMQTNVGQMHEVARNSQVRTDAILEQQHVLDKESNEKSRLINSKLEENKKAEKTIIMNEDKRRFKGEKHKGKDKGEEKEEESKRMIDDKMGRIIDVKK